MRNRFAQVKWMIKGAKRIVAFGGMQAIRDSRCVQLFAGPRVQLVFKIAYVLLTVLSFNSFFADTKLLSYGSYVLAAFGALVLLARLVAFPSFKKMPLLPLLVLFALSFILSSAFSAEYGILSNIQGFAWLTFEFFILFLHSFEESKEHACAELDILARILLVYTLLCSTVGVAMGVVGYYDYIWWGFRTMNVFGVYAGRLWGVYSDPNIGAVLCLLALLLASWLWRRGKLPLWALIAQGVVQVSYISLAGSRTATLACVAVAFLVACLCCFAWFSGKSAAVRRAVLKALLAGLCCAALAVGGVYGSSFLWSSAAASVQSSPGYVAPKQLFREILQWDTSGWVSEERPEGTAGAVTESSELDEASGEGLSEGSAEALDVAEGGIVVGEAAAGETVGSSLKAEEHSLSADEGAMGIGARTDMETHGYGVSSGRFDIWKSALEVFASTPLTGTSHRNILPYAMDVLPETHIAQLGYSTMHNVFIDVLVSQGIIGFAIFCVALFFAVKRMIAFWRCVQMDAVLKAVVLGGILAVCVSALFYTEILYINSPLSIMFWILLGFVCFVGSIDEHCSGQPLRR